MHSDSNSISSQSEVTDTSLIRGFVSLVRPVNALVTFFGIAAACVIAGARYAHWDVILLAASAGMLAGAAGNIINDVFDVDIDRVNKPGRAIVSGRVTRGTAVVWSAVSMLAALLLSFPLGELPLLIVVLSGILMYAYSSMLKRIVLVGNIVVGILTGLAFIFGAVAAGNPQAGFIPALFALFFNFAREILKDVEDVRGDRAGNILTFPIHAGERSALMIVSITLVVVMLGTIVPAATGIYSAIYFWVVFFGVDCVLAYVLISMWNDRSTGNIARLNVLLKFDMLAGIAAILMGSLSV